MTGGQCLQNQHHDNILYKSLQDFCQCTQVLKKYSSLTYIQNHSEASKDLLEIYSFPCQILSITDTCCDTSMTYHTDVYTWMYPYCQNLHVNYGSIFPHVMIYDNTEITCWRCTTVNRCFGLKVIHNSLNGLLIMNNSIAANAIKGKTMGRMITADYVVELILSDNDITEMNTIICKTTP